MENANRQMKSKLGVYSDMQGLGFDCWLLVGQGGMS